MRSPRKSSSEWLGGMPLPERARTLIQMADELTICSREFEAAPQQFKDSAIVIKKLIGLSQLQHQLSAQVGHYMDREEITVYPIDVIAKILFEKATYYQILPFLRGAISRTKKRLVGRRGRSCCKIPVALGGDCSHARTVLGGKGDTEKQSQEAGMPCKVRSWLILLRISG
jgi:hypothetical protein